VVRAAKKSTHAFQRAFESAVAEHQRGNLPGAIERYEQLRKQRPSPAGVLANLATALKQSGRRDQSLDILRTATVSGNAPAETWFNFGNLLAELGQLAEAEAAYLKALDREPGLYRAATNLARLLVKLGRTDEAIDLHRRAIAIAPNNAPSLRLLARLLYDRGALEEAESCYHRAHDADPKNVDALNGLGVVLKDRGRSDEAIDCWRKAIKIEPRHPLAYNNLGVMLRLMRRPREAVAWLRKAVELSPRDAMYSANLAHALIDLGQIAESEAISRGIIAREPGNAEGHLMLGFALVYEARVDEAIERFLDAHRQAPQSALVISNALFASLYSDHYDAAGALALHRELAPRIIPAGAVRTTWNNSGDAERRLRVGYLSPDMRNHPVSAFFEPILAHHDARTVESFCYSTTSAPDAVTARLRPLATVWRDCQGMSDLKLVELIEHDAVDILVDLAGHTAQNRAPVLRCKPAPVQVLYIGYPGTSGLPEVDYLIASARICPPGSEVFCSERVARVEGSFWCYRPPENAPEPGPLPALENGYITFGSYNALQKMSPATVALWARVLAAVPGSRLLLKALSFADVAVRRAVQCRFVDAGIEVGRVETLPPSDSSTFLAEYRRLDIALDPYPYNGGTTSCEALWMGVPVITLAGERFAARMGMSLLEGLELGELVARSMEEYVQIASTFAADLLRLGALRSTLRSRMAGSELCDGARAARELEQAYRAMWRAWMTGSAVP
jgi:predicted O-linked N-acetylglucosamine transferase (SPINDLY family)